MPEYRVKLENLSPEEIQQLPIKMRIEYMLRNDCKIRKGFIGICVGGDHQDDAARLFELGKKFNVWAEE